MVEDIKMMVRKARLRRLWSDVVEFWRLYKQSRSGLIGLGIILFFVAIAILAPYISPYDPYAIVGTPFEAPSSKHILGTDDSGKDVFSQVIYGTQTSLAIGFLAALSITAIGIAVGVIAGYFGGIVDIILIGLIDIILVLPALPLMIVLAAYLGPSIWNIVLVITIVGWAGTARIIRSQVLSLKEFPFIEAARAVGSSPARIIVKHILPNILPLALANMILQIPRAIVIEAGLSFLGLGDPTHVSWGMILYFAQNFGGFSRGCWWWIIPPGVSIVVASSAFIFVGQALDAIVNPRLRKI